MTLREKFRKAFLDITLCPFTHTHDVMWNLYRNTLREIKPEVLPKKFQQKFADVLTLIEEKIEKTVKRKVRHEEYCGRSASADDIRNKIMAEKRYYSWDEMPLKSMSHDHGKRIKETLFEIYEGLPKREKSAEKAKEFSLSDYSVDPGNRDMTDFGE